MALVRAIIFLHNAFKNRFTREVEWNFRAEGIVKDIQTSLDAFLKVRGAMDVFEGVLVCMCMCVSCVLLHTPCGGACTRDLSGPVGRASPPCHLPLHNTPTVLAPLPNPRPQMGAPASVILHHRCLTPPWVCMLCP